MQDIEFWAIKPKDGKFYAVPVFQEMSAQIYCFDTECAAITAKHSLDNLWPSKWDHKEVPHLHYRPWAPLRLQSVTLANNSGNTHRHKILCQTKKAINLNGEWVPRRALYKIGAFYALRRWFSDKLTQDQQRKLYLI